jgi:tocopherol cyclase
MSHTYPLHACLVLMLSLATLVAPAQEMPKETRFSDHKFLPFYGLKKAGNTRIFQGNRQRRQYFEGWYFKMVARDGASILSVIPGISLSEDGEAQHAFIQVINGLTTETSYHSFAIEAFSFSRKTFAVRIGDNYFSRDSLILNIRDDSTTIAGRIHMHQPTAYRSGRLLNPGIMGWYRFVPFMECYHGVVSLTHGLSGTLTVNGDRHDFEGGKGYIEKDWGESMPSAWIWMQSNNFEDPGSSLMLSIADIPWRGKSFTGFLGFFYHEGQVHHFATYRPTKLQLEVVDPQRLNIRLENRRYTFLLKVTASHTGLLQAPVAGAMDRRIPESIDATIEITMLDQDGNILMQDRTEIAGLEMVGDYAQLAGKLK